MSKKWFIYDAKIGVSAEICKKKDGKKYETYSPLYENRFWMANYMTK